MVPYIVISKAISVLKAGIQCRKNSLTAASAALMSSDVWLLGGAAPERLLPVSDGAMREPERDGAPDVGG